MKKFCINRFGMILAAAVIVAIAGAQGLRAQDQTGGIADTDGTRQTDSGIANGRLPSSTPISPDAGRMSQPLDAEGAEPPDCAKGFDLDDAYKAYLRRQRISMISVARADVDK